jgi:hypothetical protein
LDPILQIIAMSTPSDTVTIFDGGDNSASQSVVQWLADGSVVVDGVDSGVDIESGAFDFVGDGSGANPFPGDKFGNIVSERWKFWFLSTF